MPTRRKTQESPEITRDTTGKNQQNTYIPPRSSVHQQQQQQHQQQQRPRNPNYNYDRSRTHSILDGDDCSSIINPPSVIRAILSRGGDESSLVDERQSLPSPATRKSVYHSPAQNSPKYHDEAMEMDRYWAAIGGSKYHSRLPAASQSSSSSSSSAVGGGGVAGAGTGLWSHLSSNSRSLVDDNSTAQLSSSSTAGTENDGVDQVPSSNTYTTNETMDNNSSSILGTPPSKPKHQQQQQQQGQYMSFSSVSEATRENLLVDELMQLAEDDYFRVKQSTAYCAITITAIQLLVLAMQLALCGTAPLDVNPMIGAYPDAFSEWGGKNAYLLIEEKEWFRLMTPAFLHVGILHLLCNAVVQLDTCAFFEREWGTPTWLIIYVLSEVGCVIVSCVLDPDTIAVGSSGAIVGLFGAKFAQLLTNTLFRLINTYNAKIRMEQLSAAMCSFSVIALLSFVTYIDWSGHAGGFATGFCVGIVAFARPIQSGMMRFLWSLIGLALLGTGGYYTFAAAFDGTTVVPDEDLSDPCEYFRNLYAEGYDCACVWR